MESVWAEERRSGIVSDPGVADPPSGLYNPPLPHIWYMCEGNYRGTGLLPSSRSLFCAIAQVAGPNNRGEHERGQSSAKDPVTISPAGSYVAITTPVVETLLSTSFSPEGMVLSENRRLPDPMTRGKTHRRYWSTRLWRNSVCIRFPLPCTCNSGPSSFLSAAMPSAASPSIRTELLHSSMG